MTYREIYSKLQGSIDATLPPVKTQLYGNNISKQDVMDAIDRWAGNMSVAIALPTQEIKPLFDNTKIGNWIAEENEEMETIGYYCSECDLPMETEKRTDLCPNCGAKMSEIPTGAESEDKK